MECTADCEHVMTDGKDWEGKCQFCFHPYCAGVSVIHFESLSSVIPTVPVCHMLSGD